MALLLSVVPPLGSAPPAAALIASVTVEAPTGQVAGAEVVVTATVTPAQPTETVTFTATPIQSANLIVTPVSATTNDNGVATATIQSIKSGTTTITVTGNGFLGPVTDVATSTWVAGPPQSVGISHVGPTTNEVDAPHSVKATVRDFYFNLVENGTSVNFTASGTGGENPSAFTGSTLNGVATYTFTSSKAGTSSIVATAQGTSLRTSNTLTKIWVCPAVGIASLGFFAYSSAFTKGMYVASGDIDNDGCDEIITGAAAGGGPHVRVFHPNGVVLTEFMAYEPSFTGGVRVAAGDIDGDGKDDIITGAGPGGRPRVRVFSGAGLSPLKDFSAYVPAFTGGVYVAAGDVNNDGRADIITGADAGGGPHVKAFSGINLLTLHTFFAYGSGFHGGVRVGSADVNGDGFADILTAAGPGGGPHVEAFSGLSGSLLTSFFAYVPSFTGGVFVAGGDVVPGGGNEIVTGPDAGGGPHVKVFNGSGTTVLDELFAYVDSFRGGVRVAASEVNSNGNGEAVTGPGPGGGPHLRLFE